MLKILGAIAFSLYFFCSGCINPVGYTYEVKKRADLSSLLVFYYDSNIFGIDTTNYMIKAHININDMAFGGVAKLPNGGIAFTHRRRASNNAWANGLYVTDKDCNLLGTYEICYSPMGPKVMNNLLLVGSNEVNPGITYKFQIYDTDKFNMKKEYSFRSEIDGWRITNWNNEKAYLGVNPDGDYPDYEYSYVVELDLNTLDTAIFFDKIDFFLNASLVAIRQNSYLYIFNALKKGLCKYDLAQKSIVLIKEESEYQGIVKLQAERLLHPYFYNGVLYGQLAKNGEGGKEITHLVEFDPSTLTLLNITALEVRDGYISGAHKSYAEKFLIKQFIRDTYTQVVFYNIETGNIEHEVTFR